MRLRPNASKCSPPKLPDVVPRQRLLQRLKTNGNSHLILVIGQAAQGKSTLVAEHLSARQIPAAWLHMDLYDSDSANFYHLLICALSHCLPTRNLEEYIEQAHVALSTSDATVRYESMLRSLWQRLPEDITIVIDGLEQIPDGAATHELIELMIALAADKGCIIILSRQLPPFKLQQWLMRRQVLILENPELAFTPQEIETYFMTIHGLELTAEGAADLFSITEGWAGGLVLISQALSRRPEAQWKAFLAEHLPKNLSRDAWRYFAEEVFDDQPDAIKDFLMKAALVEVIEPELLSPLFEDLDLQSVLDDLVGRHLFIQSIQGVQQQPMYRLNHMFQDFLRQQFEKRFHSGARRGIYGHIAELYRDRRRAEVAIAYFVKAGNLDAAVHSIKKVGTDMIIRGRFADLEAALSSLPEDLVQSDPWLLFLLTLTRRVKGGLRNIEDFQTVVQAFENKGDTRGHMLAMAFLIEAQVFAGHDPATCRKWIHRAEDLLTEHRDTPYFSFARALLWLQIGFGHIVSGLDLSKGGSACQNAYLLAHRINAPGLMANANIVAAMGLSLRGDFQRADESLEKISSFTETDAYAEYHTLRRLVNVQLALHRGAIPSARRQLTPLADEIETFGMLFLYPAYVDTKGFVQIYCGEFGAAKDTCRHLLDVATLTGNAYYEGLSYRLNAMHHYFQGRYFDAMAAADKSLELLLSEEKPTLHWMRMQQLTGQILIHLKKYDQAEQCLEQARHYFQETANTLSLSETYLCLALLAHACNEKEKTARFLTQGFAIAAERQYDHFVMLRPIDIDRCCRLAVRMLDSIHTGWSEHLLLAMSLHPPTPVNGNILKTPAPKKKQGEKKKASSSKKTVRPNLEILTLGGFLVLRNGQTPISDQQWGGNRTKLLLKAILVHGIQEIPKEIIAEDLWPEGDPRSVNQNFKVTLHRLRKILEPDLAKHEKSSFVHLKNGLVSLDANHCQVDVQVFLTCCKDIKRAVLAKETGNILTLGRRVMEIYQGDFLPEDPYAPWVEMKRLALKDEYIATLMMMADIYEEQDRLKEATRCCRAVIAADACLEQANAKLMRLYTQQGRKNDAIKVYRKLKTALKEQLAVEPDPAITELYLQVRK